ncbi:MAG: hypothetical protein ACQEW8_07540 [Actinomycetota bacterium]
MLEDAEIAELRSLHARAYGRDGELSREDGARLAELESRRRRSAPSPVSPLESAEDHAADESVAVAAEDADETRADAPSDDDEASEERAQDAEPRSGHHFRRRALVGAAALALAVGIGAGWALSDGLLTRAVASFAHADVRASLEAEGAYDPGSLSVVGEKDGVLVWTATSSAGERECVLLTAGVDENSVSCVPSEDFDESIGNLWTSLPVADDDGVTRQVSGGIMLALDGERVGFVQVWDMQPDTGWRSSYDDEEIAVLEHAESEGVDPEMINVIGADGESLIWVSRSGAAEVCLVVGTTSALTEACAPSDAEDLAVMAPDDSGILTEYRMTPTPRGDLLTILKPASTADTVSPDVLPPPVNDEIDVEFDDFSQGSSDDAG